ncbi:MAG: hypothetical protein AAF541_14145 [Pseudomonadota bacterium]
MNNNIRLSRISHPRASALAFILLIAVFVLFGIWAQLAYPEFTQPSASMTGVSPTTIAASSSDHWIAELLVALK